jgi:hypothetical protein
MLSLFAGAMMLFSDLGSVLLMQSGFPATTAGVLYYADFMAMIVLSD